VLKGLSYCSILHANKFAALETLNTLEFPVLLCNELMRRSDVTEMDLPLSQPFCIVLSVPEMVRDEVIPFKRAKFERSDRRINFNLPERLEKSDKRVSFDHPIITENELRPSSPQGHTNESTVEPIQTNDFSSLPIVGKAQGSFNSFMITMKMEQQLEKVQFSSTLYSKGKTSKPITEKVLLYGVSPCFENVFNFGALYCQGH
jgi:hypothetical protein